MKSLLIDDEGKYGGGSDHNWLFLSLEDRFVKQDFVSFAPKQNPRWNFDENYDWSSFHDTVDNLIDLHDQDVDVDTLASSAASILLESADKNIGVKKPSVVKTSMISKCLPADLLHEIGFKTFCVFQFET